jgi:5-(aminomethyl)-3-furanmethanol phosphate kinase
VPPIVYKLGGSLLTDPALRGRLESFFAAIEGGTDRLLLVGGGEAADIVRRWDATHRLGDELSHDLALRSMSFNARFVSSILPASRLVTSRAEANFAWAEGRIAVLAAAEFVAEEERISRDALPRSWNVTSDSVAAYVALRWPADGLVLLKSTSLSGLVVDAEAALRQEAVDPAFPPFASQLSKIGWVNLRAERPTIVWWQRR